MTEPPKRILIIKMSSLGDIMTALPILAPLRRAFPQAYIAWAVQREFAPVLPGAPHIDEMIPIDRAEIRSPRYWRQLRAQLHEKRFDCVLDLQMIAKSAIVAALSGASRRYGYWEAREGSGWISRPLVGAHQYGHITDRLLDVLRELDIPVGEITYPLPNIDGECREVRRILAERQWRHSFAVVAPGSRGAGKIWPVEKWQKVVAHLLAHDVAVVLTGSASERETVNRICGPFEGRDVLSLAGRTNLRQLMAWERMACLHISGDTGPLHIANALRTPIVGLYGPTLPERSGTYAHPQAWTALAAQPADRAAHVKRDDRVDMNTLLVSEVIALIDCGLSASTAEK